MQALSGLSLYDFKMNTKVSSVITIGNFEGIHLGHQALIQQAQKKAVEKGDLPCYVMTFDPHPRQLFDQKDFKPMMSLRRKLEIFKQMGIDGVYLLHFTPSFSRLSAEDFVNQFLLPLQLDTIFVGLDFTYGYRGLGNIDTLKKAGEGHFSAD